VRRGRPRARIADYVKTAKAVGKKHGIRIVTVGHAGDGNITRSCCAMI
jgi:FAD/FMN-containing dehydrogenase